MKALTKIRYKGQVYFMDERLQEFRPIDRPFESIPFNSDLGHVIIFGEVV